MIRKTLSLALMVFIVSGVRAEDPSALREVRTLYVDSFGTAEGADMIREKVKNRIFTSGKLKLAEDKETADARLLGVGVIKIYRSGPTASLVVRLVDKQDRVLWVEEASSGAARGFTTRQISVSSAVADKVVKSLMTAIYSDSKTKKQ